MIRTYETTRQKWNPTREQIAEYTREWLKNGGEIDFLPSYEPYTVDFAVFNSRYAEGFSEMLTR